MFKIAIPTDTLAFAQEVELEGSFYTLRLAWNDRASSWFLDLSDANGAALATGLALRAGSPLTYHLRRRAGMPPGAFVCVDTGSDGDPDSDDLGSRVELIYLTAAEVAAVEALE